MSILVENISKKFGSFQALDRVNLEIKNGSLVGLLGPSGSGKSTLLRVLAGLELPDSGRIWLDNKKDSFESGTYARYDVRPSTDLQLHNKKTLFVLISTDHGKFIDAFGMDGNSIVEALSTQNSPTRKVSLNKFLKFGYRFKSTVPHIGYENYLDRLKAYLSNNITYKEFLCQ